MSNEFRIDKPGVYRQRDGKEVCLWPTLSTGVMRWLSVAGTYISSYGDDGRFFLNGETSSHDIVAYVSPLPAEILQRMADALAAAEYQPEQTTPATFGEALQALTEEQPQ